MAILVWCD